MKQVRACSEAEMILTYLQAEISSERFAKQVTAAMMAAGLSGDLITAPDLTDAQQNEQRRAILGSYRGYGLDSGMFKDFPPHVEWHLCLFFADDMPDIRYIEYSYWNELSAGTRRPIEAAQTIRAGKRIYDVPNDGFLKAAEHLKAGGTLPPMIFLTADGRTFVIVEGHQRMTAYALQPEAFHNVTVIVGWCPADAFERWAQLKPLNP